MGAGVGVGDWRALSVGWCVQVPGSLLEIFLKFYKITWADVLLWLQGMGCVGATTGGSSGTGVFASDSGSKAVRGFLAKGSGSVADPLPACS